VNGPGLSRARERGHDGDPPPAYLRLRPGATHPRHSGHSAVAPPVPSARMALWEVYGHEAMLDGRIDTHPLLRRQPERDTEAGSNYLSLAAAHIARNEVSRDRAHGWHCTSRPCPIIMPSALQYASCCCRLGSRVAGPGTPLERFSADIQDRDGWVSPPLICSIAHKLMTLAEVHRGDKAATPARASASTCWPRARPALRRTASWLSRPITLLCRSACRFAAGFGWFPRHRAALPCLYPARCLVLILSSAASGPLRFLRAAENAGRLPPTLHAGRDTARNSPLLRARDAEPHGNAPRRPAARVFLSGSPSFDDPTPS